MTTSLSVFFLPRDAMPCVTAVFAVARWPSVTLVNCMQTAEDISSNFFLGP